LLRTPRALLQRWSWVRPLLRMGLVKGPAWSSTSRRSRLRLPTTPRPGVAPGPAGEPRRAQARGWSRIWSRTTPDGPDEAGRADIGERLPPQVTAPGGRQRTPTDGCRSEFESPRLHPETPGRPWRLTPPCSYQLIVCPSDETASQVLRRDDAVAAADGG